MTWFWTFSASSDFNYVTVVTILLPYCENGFMYVLYVAFRTFLEHPYLLATY